MMCGGGSWQGYATEACMRPDCGNTTTGKLLITQIVFQDVGQMLHIGKYDWYFKRLMPNVPLFDPSWQMMISTGKFNRWSIKKDL